ncbi:zinc finger protein 862-like [Ruditapes philippinarum]|uniref:zinc finger protein 862-like n=1 Tax=Ruditapes philippinarum TaxID=129788 RepID=UPI00295B700F|nr:zinc finger protein 862-like [Ruditapes philippinarum]
MWRFIENVQEPAKKKAKTRDQQLEAQREYDKTKRDRNFQPSWSKEFPWLTFDNDKKLMFCKVCQKFDTTGTFVNGCNNFRLQSVRIHDKSEGHLRCVGMADNTPSSEGHRTLKLLNSAAHAKLRHLFMNAHFVAKCGRPYTDYVQLCKLDIAKGLDIGSTYLTDKSCQMFISSIADTIRTRQDAKIKASPFISVISDGSTDTSSQEAEIVYVRSSVSGNVYTHFMGIRNVAKADSTNISNAIINVLNDRYGEDWKEKVIGVGTDGASVMLGKKSGVVVKLREHTNRPFIYGIHCSAHRLELAYKDAVKAVNTKWTTHQKCEALLLNLYLFYKYVPLNRSNLKSSFESIGLKVLLPTRVGGTRWLPHTKMALKHLIHGHAAIVQHLEQARQRYLGGTTSLPKACWIANVTCTHYGRGVKTTIERFKGDFLLHYKGETISAAEGEQREGRNSTGYRFFYSDMKDNLWY